MKKGRRRWRSCPKGEQKGIFFREWTTKCVLVLDTTTPGLLPRCWLLLRFLARLVGRLASILHIPLYLVVVVVLLLIIVFSDPNPNPPESWP